MNELKSLVPSVCGSSLAKRDEIFDLLSSNFDSYFNNLRSQFVNGDVFGRFLSKSTYPKMDIYQEDGKYIMKAAVPGVNPKDVKVDITPDGVVKISGSSSEENHKKEGASYLFKELKMSQFSRSFKLPENLKAQDPIAEIKDGMLTLTWQDAKVEKEESRSIEVKCV